MGWKQTDGRTDGQTDGGRADAAGNNSGKGMSPQGKCVLVQCPSNYNPRHPAAGCRGL